MTSLTIIQQEDNKVNMVPLFLECVPVILLVFFVYVKYCVSKCVQLFLTIGKINYDL